MRFQAPGAHTLHQAPHEHASKDSRLERRIGEVEPVQVLGVVRVGRRERETAAAVPVNDVLYDGAGFSQAERGAGVEGVVFEEGGGAEGVEGF